MSAQYSWWRPIVHRWGIFHSVTDVHVHHITHSTNNLHVLWNFRYFRSHMQTVCIRLANTKTTDSTKRAPTEWHSEYRIDNIIPHIYAMLITKAFAMQYDRDGCWCAHRHQSFQTTFVCCLTAKRESSSKSRTRFPIQSTWIIFRNDQFDGFLSDS